MALPEAEEHWSLTTLREKLIKIGAKVVRHGRYVAFQLAEAAMQFLDQGCSRLRQPKVLPSSASRRWYLGNLG